MRSLLKRLATALRRFGAALGWPRLRLRPEAVARVAAAGPQAARAAPAEEIAWPGTRRDRGGGIRRYDPPPGMVYARQIAEYLGHRSPETVLKYFLLPGPDGATLPGGPPFSETPHEFDGRNFFAYDEHFESYCPEAHARSIVERVRYREGRAG